MIERASNHPRICAECESYTADGCCLQYRNLITGADAFAIEARRECGGELWRQRVVAGRLERQDSSTIETPMATIHRDPWDKITKTYE